MISLITTFYRDSSPERQEELIFTLKENINNKAIDHIYLLVQSIAEFSDLVQFDKITLLESSGKIPTYGELLAASSKLPEGTTIVIANSDICFDATISRISNWNLEQRLLVVSRLEGRPNQPNLFYTEHHLSSDAWIFRTPLITDKCVITLGKLHCETTFICHMQRQGYEVSNVSLNVNCYHVHESGKRNYTQDDKTYSDPFAMAFPMISGAYACGVTETRNTEASILVDLSGLNGTPEAFRMWTGLLHSLSNSSFRDKLTLLARSLHQLENLPFINSFKIIPGPSINPYMPLHHTVLLNNICSEYGAKLLISTSGVIASNTNSITPIYHLKSELTHRQTHEFQHDFASHNFAQNLLFFDSEILQQYTNKFDREKKKNLCLLAKFVSPFFSTEKTFALDLKAIGIVKPFFLLVGERVGLSSCGNAESLFAALAESQLYKEYQVVCLGGNSSLEPILRHYPSAQDCIIKHASDDELKALYQSAFVHISTSLIKGLELSCIEAMQCGCPVAIIQHANKPREYWANCLTSPFLNGSSLLEMVKILQDENIRGLLSQAGNACAKKMQEDYSSKALEGFIESVCHLT
jgi:glycosyltransferase involved in cell wall biosynthesis